MNDQNPYQSPSSNSRKRIFAETDWSAQPDKRIAFDVTLTKQDVKQLYTGGLSSAVIVTALIVLFLLLMIGSLPLLVFIVPFFFLTFLATLRFRMNWKHAIRQTPRLLEPVTGFISHEGLYTSSEGYHGYSRWDDIHLIRITKNCLLVSGESWRLVSLILPWSCFANQDSAKQAMESVIKQRKNWKPIGLGDERLSEEPEDAAIFQPIDPHVRYAGEIRFNQIALTEPGQTLKRNVLRILLIAIVLLIAGIAITFNGILTFLFGGLPLITIAITFFIMLARNPLLNNRDTVAFRTEGWFCEPGFFLQAATGQSYREWKRIDRSWHDSSMLCLRLPGLTDGWYFFTRAQFSSDGEFAQACQWAETGLTPIMASSIDSPQID